MGQNTISENFTGSIIEESLDNKEVLNKIRIISTKVEKTTENHKTPWIRQWTVHTVEIPEKDAPEIADEISKSIDATHASSWYIDFRNGRYHYVVYYGKVFRIERNSKEQYRDATSYGISIGLPEYQVDFSPYLKHWESKEK